MPDCLEALRGALPWLPHQGPLDTFVHHNTLGAHEHRPFQDALAAASEVLGARVRLDEAGFRAMLADGRIDERDLRAVFDGERASLPDAEIGPLSPPDLAWELLLHGLCETHWRIRAFRVAEGAEDPVVASLTPRIRADLARGARRALARDPEEAIACITGTREPVLARRRLREQHGITDSKRALRLGMEADRRAAELGFALLSGHARRGLPARERGTSADDTGRRALHREVDALLLPVVGAFIDCGQAVDGPRLDIGLFALGLEALRRRPRLLREVRSLLRATAEGTLQSLIEELALEDDLERRLRELLLERPGWAGAVAWHEQHRGAPRLVEYAALRLLLIVACARAGGEDARRILERADVPTPGPGARADRAAQLLALGDVGPDRAARLRPQDWARLESLLEHCDQDWRCRCLQEARERGARRVWLRSLRSRAARGPRRPVRARAQFLCCIDDREESLRRALEELGGDEVETFGLAGHFHLAIRWRGVDDVHDTPRHPVGLPSSHRLLEEPVEPPRRARRLIGQAAGLVDRTGLGLFGGALLSLLVGLGAWWLLIWRSLAPRASDAALERVRARWLTRPRARLRLFREGPAEAGELPAGLTVSEAAERVGAALELIGLEHGLAPLVVVVGHGSSSLNNPHEAAHDCGACGGFRGDGNARVFAALANHPDVRRALAARGLQIPEQTRFLGGFHDTARDTLCLDAPEGVEDALPWLRRLVHDACARDAQERGRRFRGLPPDADADRALRHARGRSVDLAEVRPEYGHATNALLVIGPRALTRGLFLDRRAFLHSYEPDLDPDGRLLSGLLAAAVPVCAGINLEYYFSRVDPERFGAGTKLPHNILGRFGVINGSSGDLRTGLPWQMVEIHEPTRLLVVVQAAKESVESVLRGLDKVRQLVEKQWIQLAAVDDAGCWVWTPTGFIAEETGEEELLHAPDSPRLCRGRRDPIEPALVGGEVT